LKWNSKMGGLYKLVIWAGIVVTFLALVLPNSIFELLGLSFFQNEYFIRVYTAVNALALGILSLAAGATQIGSAKIRIFDDKKISAEIKNYTIDGIEFDNCMYSIIFMPQKLDKKLNDVINQIKRTCIIGNLRPLVVISEEELTDKILKTNTICVFCPREKRETLSGAVRSSKCKWIFFQTEDNENKFSSVGSSYELSLNLKHPKTLESTLEAAAALLASLSGLDTPRGLYLHGNWSTTYGMMALQHLGGGQIEGRYWYGQGHLRGSCQVDIELSLIIMHYSWDQRSNKSLRIGSNTDGKGMFVLPAGYEFIYGYWHKGDEPTNGESWCGARLSRDISNDMLSEKGIYSDFGLSQHEMHHLVKW
jgi:hypothetical protein